MTLTPGRRTKQTVAEEIWARLRAQILRGELAPGSRIVEMEVAGRESASQQSVREALQMLERDGLVARRGRSGTFVSELPRDGMREVFLVRRTVECVAIRRAVGRIRPEGIAELRTLIHRMEASARVGDAASLVRHDMAFHRVVYESAGHPILLQQWILIEAQLERFLITADALGRRDLSEVAASHQAIVDALVAADADVAARVAAQHVMLSAPPCDPGQATE